jgi:hypothetical protein
MKSIGNIKDQSQILIIDAIRLSFEIEKTLYSKFWRSLRLLEKVEDNLPPRPSQVINSIQYVWEIIDTVNRIRGLIIYVKGLSHNSNEYQLFSKNTKSIEDFRNFYQHLNTEIPKIAEPANPIIGVISWVTKDQNKSKTITYGSIISGNSFHSLAVDTWTNKFACNLEFSSDQLSIDLEYVHKKLKDFAQFFNEWLITNNYLLEKEMIPSNVSFYLINQQ